MEKAKARTGADNNAHTGTEPMRPRSGEQS